VSKAPRLDLDNYLPYLINRVGFALVDRFAGHELVRAHLTIAMWRVLAALSNNGEQRQIDLAGMTSIDASTLSRLVTRLVKMELVTRSRSKTSNREVVVGLSGKGRALVQRLIPVAKALEDDAIDGLSAKELEAVKRALRTMYGNLAGGSAFEVDTGSIRSSPRKRGPSSLALGSPLSRGRTGDGESRG
jgi:DNA-binding MarR family transcriptional regulator